MDESASQTPALDNRNRILACALDLFARRGYDAVGVQEIVSAAGVTKPTLYHYFESKVGLLDAVVDSRGRSLLARFRQAARYDGDVPQTLERVAFALVDYSAEEPVFYRFLLSLHFAPVESEARSVGAALLADLQEGMTESFRQANAQIGNMHGRQALFAASFLGLIHNWIGLSLNGQVRLDEATVRSVVKQFMHGIYS
jgi:TetR/AcrR family transcriptional regulator